MKKITVPFIAIILAMGFSAFTSIKSSKFQTTYYWFETKQGTGSQVEFDDVDLNFISSATSAPTGICSGTQTYKCVIGFLESQMLDAGAGILKDDQEPHEFGERKPQP